MPGLISLVYILLFMFNSLKTYDENRSHHSRIAGTRQLALGSGLTGLRGSLGLWFRRSVSASTLPPGDMGRIVSPSGTKAAQP